MHNHQPRIASSLHALRHHPDHAVDLLDLTLRLSGEAEPHQFSELLCVSLCTMTPASTAAVVAFSPDQQTSAPEGNRPGVVEVAGHGLPPATLSALSDLDWYSGPFADCLMNREPARMEGRHDHALAGFLPADHPPVGHMIGFPFIWGESGRGLVILSSGPEGPPLDAEAVAVGQAACLAFGLAYGNAILREAQTRRVRSLEAEVARWTVSDRQDNTQQGAALRAAIASGQMELHYQPKVGLMSGRIRGAEALVRWRHPERGLIPPDAFIPLAEASGVVTELGAWVIGEACRQQARWQRDGMELVPVAVNVSPVHLFNGAVADTIGAALQASGLTPQALEIEITETALMTDPAHAVHLLAHLKAMGLKLSLDDFGTGYSSLAYLKRFPLDTVKIDRAFIQDITASADDATIVTAIIAMAHRLNLRVVAEGVEVQEQLDFLRMHECDEIQGYLFSRPVPAAAFADLVRDGKGLEPIARCAEAARTLLLVDDEPLVLQGLTRVLRREGYRILTATSGREALALLAAQPIQVVVSDQRMPGMTGAEFLRVVQRLYPATIRIVLSGYADIQAIMDAINLGEIFKFLVKPCPDDQLRTLVAEAFRRHAQQAGAAPP